jgi:hypothetical protein
MVEEVGDYKGNISDGNRLERHIEIGWSILYFWF